MGGATAFCSGRHPEAGGKTASKAGKPRPTRIDGRQGERLSESSASRLAAHAKPASQRTDLLLAWAHRAAGALRQAVKACVPCLSASSAIGGRPGISGADGPPLQAVAGRLVASIWPVAWGCSRCHQLPERREGGTVKLMRVLGSA